ncbi:MAG: bifunctional 5,10-methylenetetrahydrofolate dehydrogenase/5,10-methenyltetrahydrofolate cyclohydrolase [Candidatus Gracilibacteria bacterium]|nr:bifunctional 5,10-methylenetetrahydrofolate dehydrogenase/5,10-methenyltetrahydrofolate cyclohydrolase [Candidatus Gracilibacteria bacterium]
MIIDGKEIAKKMYDELKNEVSKFKSKPTLGAILVGNNSSSLRYIEQKKKWAEYIGINFKLEKFDEKISELELYNKIKSFNENPEISGYIVQLPLPKHINSQKIINNIHPKKDVDGFHPNNQGKVLLGDESGFVPCTPAGILEIFKHEKIDLEGKVVCVIGRSNIVGKPIISLLINAGATVLACNSKTKNLAKFTTQAEIIIVAAGSPGLLKVNMLKVGAIIIDVGFTVIDGKIHGDADTRLINLVGSRVTPVPGGVGALTVACLMKNTIKAYKIQNK